MLEAIFLGFLQGITEFLPISSSGHLILFSSTSSNLNFEVLLHGGTLLSILFFFKSYIIEVSQKLLSRDKRIY